MIKIIYTAFIRTRTVLLVAALIISSGLVSYFSIPRESFPNVTIPFVNISVHHEGISPEDADRLLVGPIYKHIKTLEGLKEVKSVGTSDRAYLTLEFEQTVDIDDVMIKVREKVDIAKTELPGDSDEPFAKEYNIALQPIITLALSGSNVDEAVFFSIAEKSKNSIEAIRGILEAKIQGNRQEVVEILVDPHLLESYNIKQSSLIDMVSRNNKLVAAGLLDTEHGQFPVKVPGLFENLDDILSLPVKQSGNFVLTLKDIATVHRTYNDPVSIVRLNGQPMVSLDISKRVGANIIDITDTLKSTMEANKNLWSENLNVIYLQDESKTVRNYLSDLENSVIFATLLVMIVIISTMGFKNGVLVGLAIPGSFLTGILLLSLFGMTLNMVVLFSLILAVGMLVDASIIVIEYADRRIKEGAHRRDAFAEAAIRMSWPIAASTATTLAVFAPLLFWPGIMGQFMSYLPITLIFTLSASFVMAIILIPTLGAFGDKQPLTFNPDNPKALSSYENDKLKNLKGFNKYYVEKLTTALQAPKKVLYGALACLFLSFLIYGTFGNGITFFPESEPEFASIHIKARGEMSLQEKNKIVKQVEKQVLEISGVDKFYTTVFAHAPNQASADTIGIIRMEFSHWKIRPPATQIFNDIRQAVQHIAGVIIEVRAEEHGPAQGRDIELELSGNNYQALLAVMDPVLNHLKNTEGLVDVQDSRPPPGFEWQLTVDREKASQFGVDLSDVGDTIRLVTNGVKLGEYRPHDAEDEVDIKLRYPVQGRNMDQLDQLRITTGDHLIPISSFVEQKAAPKLSSVNRTDGRFALELEADVAATYLANDLIQQLQKELPSLLPEGIHANFKGKNEDQDESMSFLLKAFAVAIFAMAIILVTQFNSFYQAFLILSAVIFSIIGVLFGLLIRGEAFSVVMSGVGIISLAGIIVNNNIVFIDTYNIIRQQGLDPVSAALHTGAERLRPILLTTLTTILGLLPMVFEINIKLLSQEIDFGAPSGQTWTQLSTAIAAGLAFATPITLFLTPCLLVLKDADKSNASTTHKKISSEQLSSVV